MTAHITVYDRICHNINTIPYRVSVTGIVILITIHYICTFIIILPHTFFWDYTTTDMGKITITFQTHSAVSKKFLFLGNIPASIHSFVGLFVSLWVNRQKTLCTMSCDVARLILMSQIDFWQNSTPF